MKVENREREERWWWPLNGKSKVRAEKKNEIDRGRREMEASGSTRRVHEYFENSINLAPATLSSSFSFSRLTSTSQACRTHIDRSSAMKFSRRPNLSLFPGRSGHPIYFRFASPRKAPLRAIPTPHSSILDPHSPRPFHQAFSLSLLFSLFLSFRDPPLLISPSRSSYFCESIVGHNLAAIKGPEMVNRRVRIELKR